MVNSVPGYITLLIGYIILGVGIYYLSYAKGEYDCNPFGDYLDACTNIGTNEAPKFARSRYIPDSSGATDPDGSVKYVLQKDTSQCPRQDCKVGDWMPDGGCYKDPVTNTNKQNWKRTIVVNPQYGGTPCPKLSDTVNCGDSPKEPFRFLRRRRRIRIGIEKNPNYGGGIAGIVFGSIFVIVGHALIFTVKKN